MSLRRTLIDTYAVSTIKNGTASALPFEHSTAA